MRDTLGFDEIFQSEVEAYERAAKRVTPVRTGKMKGSWSIIHPPGRPRRRVLHNGAPYSGFVLERNRSARRLRNLFE